MLCVSVIDLPDWFASSPSPLLSPLPSVEWDETHSKVSLSGKNIVTVSTSKWHGCALTCSPLPESSLEFSQDNAQGCSKSALWYNIWVLSHPPLITWFKEWMSWMCQIYLWRNWIINGRNPSVTPPAQRPEIVKDLLIFWSKRPVPYDFPPNIQLALYIKKWE